MDCYKDSYLEKPETKRSFGTGLLEVEAGTNGFHGGDAGHGSSTYFKIKNRGGACIVTDINKYKKNFKGWVLDKFITDLTKISDFTSLTEANVEEAKLLLEIYERD